MSPKTVLVKYVLVVDIVTISRLPGLFVNVSITQIHGLAPPIADELEQYVARMSETNLDKLISFSRLRGYTIKLVMN